MTRYPLNSPQAYSRPMSVSRHGSAAAMGTRPKDADQLSRPPNGEMTTTVPTGEDVATTRQGHHRDLWQRGPSPLPRRPW
jgi:hypothetical protein